MIKAKHITVLNPFFRFVVNRYVNQHFKEVIASPIAFNPNQSILLIANHFSWWDGFLSYYLQHKYFKKKFHVLVLEHTLRAHFLFRWAGAFSIKKGAKSMVESLQYTADLLNDPKNLVLVYPQGKLYSNHVSKIKVEKGLGKIVEYSQNPVQLIFQVTLIDYFASRKPSAYVYFKQTVFKKGVTGLEIAQEYNQFYQHIKSQHVQQSI